MILVADSGSTKTDWCLVNEKNTYFVTGLDEEHIHFMNLEFYEASKSNQKVDYYKDVAATKALLQEIKPHQIFAAGDFADPHGTHKVCFDIIHEALKQLKEEGGDWINDCWVWLYRGAWHEFEIHEIEMAVPLSPVEVERKRNAIFKHQSQKDHAVFPGEDECEFWVRARTEHLKRRLLIMNSVWQNRKL